MSNPVPLILLFSGIALAIVFWAIAFWAFEKVESGYPMADRASRPESLLLSGLGACAVFVLVLAFNGAPL